MIAEEELLITETGQGILPDVTDGICWFINDVTSNPKNYESINVHRLKATVEELPGPLKLNIGELKKVESLQHAVPVAVKDLINAARNANSPEELQKIPKDSFKLMCAIANDENGELKPDQRINESHRSHIKDISERFKTGYIYHWSIEDELKKIPFQDIFSRLEKEQQDRFHKLAKDLDKLNESVDVAYQLNWRQISLIRRIYSVLHECLAKYFDT
jgi:hypothetical protein